VTALRASGDAADNNQMESSRVRIATTSGLLALAFSSALLATGAPAWILAIATFAGIAVIWRYTGAFALMRADWAEAKENERRKRDKRDDR
jgi:hypothetical protein